MGSLKWIENHLPPGSRIGREHYTLSVEKYTSEFDAVYFGYIVIVKNPLAARNLDYLILSSLDYGRFLLQQDRYPDEAQAYVEFFASHELVKEFLPDQEKLGGPKISIYKMR